VERALSNYYRTAMTRQESARLSDHVLSQQDDDADSPKGSITEEDGFNFKSDEKIGKNNKVDDANNESL
jgi:hypothetical protein